MKLITTILSILWLNIGLSQCTALGSLSWDKPEGFNGDNDVIMIFAKLKENGLINIGSPTDHPFLEYGKPDTNLNTLEGTIPTQIQYENDPLAMLVYLDTGNYVCFTGPNDFTEYYFASFNLNSTGGQVYNYSNAVWAIGSLGYSKKITNLLAIPDRIQWFPLEKYDTAMVIVSEFGFPSGEPSGPASGYLSGLDSSYSASTSYFNGLDPNDGKILFIDEGDRFQVIGLSSMVYTVTVYTITNGCWGKRYTTTLDNSD